MSGALPAGPIDQSEKKRPFGVPQLDSTGKVSLDQVAGGGSPAGAAGGDLGGNYPAPLVLKVNGQVVQTLAFTGSASDIVAGTVLPGFLPLGIAGGVAGPLDSGQRIPSVQLPFPTTVALGGVKATLGAVSQWIKGIATDGTPQLSRPVSSDLADLGLPGGSASLDLQGALLLSQVPSVFTAGAHYRGTWNAAANTPALVSSTGTQGDYFTVTVAGTTTLDGISSWTPGDRVAFSGTVWQKQPGAAFAPLFFADGSIIQGAIGAPNFVKIFRDITYNIAGGIDGVGKFWWQAANFDTVTLRTSLTYSGTLPFALPAIQVDGATTIQKSSGSIMPPYTKVVRDPAGNIAEFFDPTSNTKHVQNLTVHGVLKQSGQASGVPGDTIDVRSPAYGAVGDGTQNYGSVTITGGDTLTIINFSGTVSLSQLTPGTALLTLESALVGDGWAFQPDHVGKSVYLSVGGYTLLAVVTKYVDGINVWLDASGITPQVSQPSAAVTCPAFMATALSKTIIVDGMGQAAWWIGGVTQTKDTVTAYGTQPFISTIASVVNGSRVTTTLAMPFAWSGLPARVMWGTVDTNAVAIAAAAAFAAQQDIYFSGPGTFYLLPNLQTTDPGQSSYGTVIGTDAGALLNGVRWRSDLGVRAYVADTAGLEYPHKPWSAVADASRNAERSVHGRASFPRCNKLTTINVLIVGDSLGVQNPQNQSASWFKPHKFREEFIRANPGKTINFYNIAIGGSTWASLADPTFAVNNTSNSVWGWVVPRPISGTVTYSDFISNINQTGSGGVVAPDLVAFFFQGYNDSYALDIPSMNYLINKARAVSHPDGFGATDVLMMTDHIGACMSTSSSGNGGGVSLPSVRLKSCFQEFACGFQRSTARVDGYGVIDHAPMQNRAALGYDEMCRSMRVIPKVTVTASPTAPFVLPIKARGYSMWFSLTGANDAAVWAALQAAAISGQLDAALSFQISPQKGNRVLLRVGNNGHIWAAVAVYGRAVPTTCTITNGGTSLSVAAPTTIAGLTFTQKSKWQQLEIVSGGSFSSGMVGQCIVAPLGNSGSGGRQPQRTFIRTYLGAQDVFLDDYNFDVADITAATGATFTVGGAQFVPIDSTVMPDVVIYYADGTIFSTKVASGGYVSATQVTLADPAPAALTATSVPVFVGLMGPKWFDTGIAVSGTTTGTWEIDVTGTSLMLGYKIPTQNGVSLPIDIQIKRGGWMFYPLITPAASQEIAMTDMWVDDDYSFAANLTPWECMGLKDDNADYFRGGVGGHFASTHRPAVQHPFYSNQNFNTY